ncbi:NAD(P)H-hydrate dehydratase [Caldivirga sp.]|uniref:NAD(P)H-hydrate dehydratase n=1 Tax=Caldivirga sp. TaxID=2080243 RepID=UPI0025BB1B5A|nr:NAD(P)H-hydrate dehydratase [Caldivirga sp.]
MSSEAISVLEMRVLDANTTYLGIDSRILMENAGRGVAQVVSSRWPNATKILVVAGLGNNGGDGIVSARYLYNWGKDVVIVLLGRVSDMKEEPAATNLKICLNLLGCRIMEARDELELLAYQDYFIKWADVIIDAILGIGVKGRIRQPASAAIDLINMSKAPKVAVDIPSGLDPDTGDVTDKAVKADLTVTMHKAKRGLIVDKAKPYVGELVVVDIGIPREAELIVGPGDLNYLTYARRLDSKKGDFGRIAIIGGSRDYTGAIALTALASLVTGADLPIVYAPHDVAHDIRSQTPNLIAVPLEGDFLSKDNVGPVLRGIERANVVAIGPGLGLERVTMEAVYMILDTAVKLGKRIVIDADAIKAIGIGKRLNLLKSGVVLTPHAGELKELLGIDVPKLNPVETGQWLKEQVSKCCPGSVILLKGNTDIISDGSRFKLNMTGNPGMTVGGTGDVLTGVLATILHRVNDPLEAAAIAAFITGVAGDLAALELGYHLTPMDVVTRIPKAFSIFINTKGVVEEALHKPLREFLVKHQLIKQE